MSLQRKLSPTEIATFCSEAGWLIHAGMTPANAMSVLISDTQNPDGRKIYEDIFAVCKNGEAFSKGLKASEVFPDYCVQLIRLGEESGNLDECLQALTTYYEKEDNLRQSFKSAISYPLIMILMMFVVIYVLMSKVLPIFRQVFDELGTEMSGIASGLLSLGETLNRYTWILVLAVVGLVILILCFSLIPALRKLCNRFLNWFPPTKTLIEQYASQRFANGMAMTLRSGINTVDSLDLLAEITNSQDMNRKIQACKEELKKGGSFSEVLSNSGIFSNLHSRMISIGFRSGNLDAVMTRIAETYEKETDRKMQSIISVLEPTLVIILSVIVGIVLLSVILPLMGIMSSIG
ncbi:MAG: type II secretion system F family protein [Lachnospiraceae bacterium]|nr:type II secretion system F family protein [Lachnospiraceae bacterium]